MRVALQTLPRWQEAIRVLAQDEAGGRLEDEFPS
jgi:hypothetical protein